MSHGSRSDNLGVLLLAGIGAGALTGVLLGLMAARRPRAQADGETVEGLRRRAEQILSELSQAATSPAAPERA